MGAGRAVRFLAVTGGHRVDLDAFTGMLGDICAERSWAFAHAVQPAVSFFSHSPISALAIKW